MKATQRLGGGQVASKALELAFVCEVIDPKAPYSSPEVPRHAVLESLDNFAAHRPDLIVEVAHPSISAMYGAKFLGQCDYMPASVTAFADEAVERSVRDAASGNSFCRALLGLGSCWDVSWRTADDLGRTGQWTRSSVRWDRWARALHSRGGPVGCSRHPENVRAREPQVPHRHHGQGQKGPGPLSPFLFSDDYSRSGATP